MKTFAVLVAAVSMVVGCAGEASEEDIAGDVDSSEAAATAAAPVLEEACRSDVNVSAKLAETIAAFRRQHPTGIVTQLPATQLRYSQSNVPAQRRTAVNALLTFPIVLQKGATTKILRSVQCRIGSVTVIQPNGQPNTTRNDPKLVQLEFPETPTPGTGALAEDPIEACKANRDVAKSIAAIGPALARVVGAPARIGEPTAETALYAVTQQPNLPLATHTLVTFKVGVTGSVMTASRSTQCRVVQRNGRTARVDLIDVDLF